MEKALAAVHQGLSPGTAFTLSYGVVRGEVTLLVECAESLVERIVGPILANYPQASMAEIEGGSDGTAERRGEWSATLELAPQLFPILRHGQFEDLLARRYADPIDSVLRSLRPDEHLQARVELQATPARTDRRKAAKRALKTLDRAFFRKHRRLADYYVHRILSPRPWFARFLGFIAARSAAPDRSVPLDLSASRTHEREADMQAAADKLGGHLFDVRLRIVVSALPGHEPEVEDRLETIAAAFGAFTRSRLATFRRSPTRPNGTDYQAAPFLLSHEELATLWHPPTVGTGADRMASTPFAEHEAPAVLPTGAEEHAVPLGRTRYRSEDRSVGLRREDRWRHVYIVGKTGMGKTTLLLNQIAADLNADRGVCLVDPHGDLADAAIRLVPPHRTNETIIFDAGDREYAIGFNPLACSDPSRVDQVASGVVSALRKLYDSWGPRLDDSLRNAVYVAVEQQGTLLDVLQLLGDSAYRERVVPQIRDAMVRTFWMREFAAWSRQYRTEAVAAIQNKIRPFLTNTTVRAIVSQRDRSLDLRAAMDEGKILIVNLSKGRLGEDNSALLGSLIVTSLQQAAMTRAEIPERDRRDFHLYVDEFQNFTTGSFATILSEARKYRLTLTLAHQYLKQLDPATADAIAGNVGTMIALQTGSDDAEWLAAAMSKSPGQLAPHDLTNLPRYTACVRLLIDGSPSVPFTITTLPPPQTNATRTAVIVERSRRQYARPIAEVLQTVEHALAR
jgi:hypothetical protein